LKEGTVKENLVRASLVIMGVLTMTPALVLVDPGQLASYGVTDPDLIELTLLQHRGVYQLLLGAGLVVAAFRADLRVPVSVAAIVAKGGFLLLTVTRPEVLAVSSPVTMVFDPVCVVLLTAYLVDRAVARTRAVPA
jgi:hypothetical protein